MESGLRAADEPDEDTLSVAAVIPTYQRAFTIGRAIQSVLDQTRPVDEIIVIDDGSTDDTAAVVAAFGDRISYVRQPNGGVPVARNRGTREATTPWVAFLDSDDYWRPDHIERCVMAIRATEGQAALYAADTRRPADRDHLRQWELAGLEVVGDHQCHENGADLVFTGLVPFYLQSSVFDREVLMALGGLSEALPMRDDTHIFFKLCMSNPVCLVNHVGAVMTDDDQGGLRLTTSIGPKTRRYTECSVSMWSDLLDCAPTTLAAPHRAWLEEQQMISLIRLARFDATDRHFRAMAEGLAQALRLDPAGTLRRFAGHLRRSRDDAKAA